ncbi:MAG: hypothetical protein KA368_12115 [Acidobacteria bacterium]|nr:hypothetical protein [Acidobacteriota bacterium]
MNSMPIIFRSKSRVFLLLAVTSFCTLSYDNFGSNLTSAQVQQPSSNDRIDSIAGAWDLFVTVDGAASSEQPSTIVLLAAGNKLTGKIVVPKVEPTANGLLTSGSIELTLSDLKLNDKTFSFKVSDDGNEMNAELVKLNDNEYEGRWRSPVQGRWKSEKSEFAGAIKIKRKK